MANLQYTSDLKQDVLFRGGEQTDGTSDFDDAVLEYINRAYLTLAMGGLEFNEDIQEEWWWLRKDPPGTIILQPPVQTGSVTVTNNSTTITFSSAPAFSATGYFFRSDTDSDVFRVSSHTSLSATATLDSVFTGETGAGKTYTLFKLEYALASDVLRVIAPMRGYTNTPFEVDGCELSALERDWPLNLTEKGAPSRFAMVTESKVRFNRSGIDSNGSLLRLEYDYLQFPTALANTLNEEPLVPRQYRHILADMALFWLYIAKDDNRDVKLAEIVKRGIRAMSNENRHRMSGYSRKYGRIAPRQPSGLPRTPLRTTSGLIIG